MRKTYKFLSVFLAVLMIFSIIPITASAATSGKCGDNLTWTFDDSTDTLTISGTGEMYDYNGSDLNNGPWKNYREKCKTIIVNNGVTKIGQDAFRWFLNVTNITLPDSLIIIDEYAFEYCDSLTSVTIPNSVTTIGKDAFSGCNSLKSIVIPDSVVTIGVHAFSYCNSLESVTIGNGITTIGDYAFYSCDELSDVTLGNNIKTIGRYAFGYCIGLEIIQIPDSVTSLGDYAFDTCSALTSVILGNGLTTIGRMTFFLCKSLESITIPDSVTTIGYSAFDTCSGLTNVTLGNGLTTIDSRAFQSCSSLKEITIPDSVSKIGEGAFNSCSNITEFKVGNDNKYFSSDDNGVLFNKDKTILIQYPIGHTRVNYKIPDGVTTIGYSSFYNCNKLESITIPDTVVKINDWACCFGSSFKEVFYLGTEEDWNMISVGSYNESLKNATIHYKELPSGKCGYNLTWVLDESTGVLTISGTGDMFDYSIYGGPWNEHKSNIKEVVINDGVTSIGQKAFIYHSNITNVTLPDSLEVIDESAFYYCSSLSDITIPDSVKSIGSGAFFACESLTGIRIPNGIKTINQGLFVSCINLVEVVLLESVTHIDDRAFQYCGNLTDVYYLGTEEQWKTITIDSDNGYLLNARIHFNNCGGFYKESTNLPTCTESGYTIYSCSCGYIYMNDEVSALGHTPANAVEENYVAPTCTENGSKDVVVYCSVCKEEISRETETLEVTGHSYTSEITTPATHLTTGVETFTCAICNDTYTESIAKTEKHNYESVVTPPTCTQQGYTTYTCECGDSYKVDYTNSTGHKLEWVVLSVASCNTNGVEHGYCENCSYYEVKTTPMTDHQHKAVVTAPTCTEQGYTTYTCECGDSYVSDYVNALGHTSANAVEENYVAPTCTENGSKDIVIYCSVCDEEISRETETLDTTGHADNDGDGYCDADNELLDPTVECECNCHKSGISKFFFNLILFFQKLFGSNEVCSCGVAHY